MKSHLENIFVAVAIDDEGRACSDIPESACQEEPRSFFIHVIALTLSKISDGLIDPKLVLSWLLTAMGAPVALIGLLVPIREAGALLPQLFTAGYIRRQPIRKWFWAAGAFVQGGAALAIAIIALTLSGTLGGIMILVALAFLALARSICSVSYKDVLGKTIALSRRGRATGLAGSLAAGGVIIFALLLMFEVVPRRVLVTAGLIIAGCFWILSSYIFSRLDEKEGATEGGKAAIRAALDDLSLLNSDAQLRRFILTRGLLMATALAPPFMIALTAEHTENVAFKSLGALVLASSLAGLLSAYVWGRLADKSSRKVLMGAAIVSGLALVATCLLSVTGLLGQEWALPVVLFVLMIAYQGVRLGRSVHLVDMASEQTRASYTALSNTIIGILLMLGGIFSFIAEVLGTQSVIVIMSLMCFAALISARTLEEVQTA